METRSKPDFPSYNGIQGNQEYENNEIINDRINKKIAQEIQQNFGSFQYKELKEDSQLGTERPNLPTNIDPIFHSYSCNYLTDKVEDEKQIIDDTFKHSIEFYAKTNKEQNKINNKCDNSSDNSLKKSNSIIDEQYPQMDFQIIRQILQDLVKDEQQNNGVQIKENEYRKQFSYGREPTLQWKGQPLPHPSQTKYLRIATLTWNLHGSCPTDNLAEILAFLNQSSHHQVVIGTQECERSIAASFFNSSKSRWEQAILDNMSNNYIKVHSLKMNALHLIILCHKILRPYIKNIQSDRRATGIANYLGNKGGLGISFDIGKRSYLFVNLHLSSGKENKERRNKDFMSVENNLNLGKKISNMERSSQDRVSNRFDYVFFIGDMNYRINIDIGNKDINEHNYIQLLLHDQLIQEIELIASHFKEGMITFPPTYKLDLTYNRFYTGKKKRQPAWTDRILYKSYKQNTMFQISYDSNTNIMGSDHRPVYAQFLVQHLFQSTDDQTIKYF